MDLLHDYENYAKPLEHRVSTDNHHKKSDAIKLQNVSFSYKEKLNVIKKASLTIKSGETVAIVGRNGSGKTTLAHLILGLYYPNEGEIFVNGKSPDIKSSECRIASVPQNFGHYGALTLQDNILMGQDGFSHSKLQKNIKKVDINERLKNKLDSTIGNQFNGIELSGGEWQRLALLRPLFTDADIVLFDEPTAALDPISEVEIFKQFMEIYQEKTQIIISHRLGATKEADKIVVMEDGEIIGIGTHQELLLNCPLYTEMYHSQASWYNVEDNKNLFMTKEAV
jgi:ABC-type multidrug transport system fused ATPase/permease subunit